MKKLLIYILALPLGLFFTGCKKEIMGYEGKEGVYFAVQHGNKSLSINSWPFQPFSDVEFVRIGQSEVDFPVKVMITGPVKDYDRVFRLEVNPDSTTAVEGQHYAPLQTEWKILARQTTVDVKIRLKRSPDLENKAVTLGLRLVETSDFKLSFPEWDAIPSLTGGVVVKEFDASLHTLRINDVMIQPAVWPGSIQAGNRESGLFGAFTRKKMQFLIDNLGLKYEDFASSETMPQARYLLVASDAAEILKARFNANNPVLEDDGRLMFIGSVPWTSIIGVPF
ncbi:DUF4843 domain-containing protein [Pedobacter sp. SL55]|uniref:DUF4843 domain-containing protein n=1 Tax=Pedobacter sp. SL55 TaxID=2995161 RepID=UPI00226ED421|nr:DUF4843 domain-containing protein [Pedobacter sp. SL55]WAC39221.1 DUF4843 domain-containing protein [Pedobacter sp. SL55]